MKKVTAPLVILTDIHIRSAVEPKYLNLLSLIRRVDSRQVKYFILLGDIFDFCFGKSSYFQKKYSEFVLELEKLAQSEVKVIYVQGNHEYSMESMPWRHVQVITKKIYKMKNFQGKKIAFCHGDDLLASNLYKKIMITFRSKLFTYCLWLFPAQFLDKICLNYARYSHSKNKPLDKKKLFKAAKEWLLKENCDFGFAGHFHREFVVEIKKKQLGNKMFFLGANSPPSYYTFDQGELKNKRD